jgi:CheY-like chemotaxis protein
LLWLAPTQLSDTLHEVVRLLHRTIDPRIRLHLHAAPDLWLVHADPGQITQVLMNLCLNACDAMTDGGDLTLELANVTLDHEQVRATLDARPGEFVRLIVRDTGHGIPEDILPRVFDPFFTTKETGKGTGLGLAMVFGIIKQHQGWIECESQLGEGTTFTVYLPRHVAAEQPTSAEPSEPQPTPPDRPTATILVAEDNEMLRNLVRTILKLNGFQILVAADGQEAVELFRTHRDSIDLILLDVQMPRLSGLEALAQIRQIDATVPVLLASGYSETPPDRSHGAQGFIGKPYREHDLLTTIREALLARA